MADPDLTPDELETLCRFQWENQLLDVDGHHDAELLFLTLLKHTEGGSAATGVQHFEEALT